MDIRPASARHRPRFLILASCLLLGSIAQGQTPLFDDVHTIATADVSTPLEYDVNIPADGNYQVQLTDNGTQQTPPAPLAAVTLAVTSGDAIVGTPLAGAGTLQLAAKAGNYRIHVVGTPGTVPGSGPIGIKVTTAAGGPVLATFSGTLGLPQRPIPSAVGVLDDSFTVASAGNYQVTLADLALPQSLSTLTLLLSQPGAQAPVTILPDATNNNALTSTVALQPGVSYRIFAIGQAAGSGGLYSVIVAPQGGGAAIYTHAVPEGGTTLVGTVTLSAGPYGFNIADLALPASLTQVAAAVVLNGQAVASLAATGSQAFTAVAGSHQLFVFASPDSSGAGSYTAQIAPLGVAPVLAVARAVSAPGSAIYAYSYDTTVASAAGYTLNLVDFQAPRALLSGSAAAIQNGAVVGTPLTAPGSANISPVAGPLTLLVFASPGTGGGLLDVNLTASDGSLPFDRTEGVGAAFSAQTVTIPSAGIYTVTATDLQFPALFGDLAVVVTRGGTQLGSIFAGGTITLPQLAAGNYTVNLLATPSGTEKAGTYALNVSTAPPAPVVTLTANPTSVTSGGTVALSWTSTNADSCTGSGGGWTGHYTGAQAASGSDTSPPVSAVTTFTISCQGTGGTTAQPVTVNIAAPPAKSGGGGGALRFDVLAALLAALLARDALRRRPAGAGPV